MPAAKVRVQMKAVGDVLLLSCEGRLSLLFVVMGRSPSVIRGAFASSFSSAMVESSYDVSAAVLAVWHASSLIQCFGTLRWRHGVYITLQGAIRSNVSNDKRWRI